MAHLGTQPHVGTIARAHEGLQKAFPPPPKRLKMTIKRQCMNLGVSVHMGTFWVLWASRGGHEPIADTCRHKMPKIEQHMELGPQVCHFRWLMGKKCSFISIVLFLAICALKSRFLSLLWGLNPLLRPKVPKWADTPMFNCLCLCLIVYVLPRQLTKNTDPVCKLRLLFLTFSHFKYFGSIFDHFWPPTVPHTGLMVTI